MLQTATIANYENVFVNKKFNYQCPEERAILEGRLIETMVAIGFNPN